MSQSRVELIIEDVYRGASLDAVLNDLDALQQRLTQLGATTSSLTSTESSFASTLSTVETRASYAARAMDALDEALDPAHAQRVEDGLQDLTNEMQQAEAEAKDLATAVDRTGKELEDFGRTTERTKSITAKFGDGLKSMVSTIGKVQAATLIFAGVVKKAFDFAREGAELQRMNQRMDALAISIGTTGDALRADLSVALRGLVSDMSGVQMATDLLRTGLVTSHEEVIRLASASAILGMDLGQLTLTLANKTVMRFDQLGVSLDGFKERWRELTKELGDKDAAFRIAFIEQAEKQVDLLGGAVDDNAAAFDRLAAKVTNAKDAFIQFLSTGLAPVANVLSGHTGDVLETQIADKLASLLDLQALVMYGYQIQKTIDDVGELGFIVTGTFDELRSGIWDWAIKLAQMSGDVDTFMGALQSSGENVYNIFADMAAAAGMESDKQFYYYAMRMGMLEESVNRARSAEEHYNEVAEETQRLLRAREAAAYLAGVGMESVAQATEWAANALNVYRDATAAMGDSWDLSQRLQKEWGELQPIMQDALEGAIGTIFDATTELYDAYEDLADAQGVWVSSTVDNSREIEEINSQLFADLTQEQRKYWQQVLTDAEEGSASWLEAWANLQADLTDTQRQELVAQRADLQAHNGELAASYTGNVGAAKEAQEEITKAYEAIAEAHRQMVAEIMIGNYLADGSFDDSEANVLVALGIMSREEANFMLQQSKVADSIRLLAGTMKVAFLEDMLISRTEAELMADALMLIDAGVIGADEALDAFQKGTLQELIATAAEAAGKVDELQSSLDDLTGDWTATVNVRFNIPDMPDFDMPGYSEDTPWWLWDQPTPPSGPPSHSGTSGGGGGGGGGSLGGPTGGNGPSSYGAMSLPGGGNTYIINIDGQLLAEIVGGRLSGGAVVELLQDGVLG